MPRPRKPTAALELSGAFAKNPQRKGARANEPKPEGEIGAPPGYFDKDTAAIWHEYVAEAAPGVLTVSDRKVLELTCRLTRKMRVAPGRMTRWLSALGEALTQLGVGETLVRDMKNDLRAGIGMSAQEQALLKQCLTSLGFTPADRSKVNAISNPKPEEDEFSQFLN